MNSCVINCPHKGGSRDLPGESVRVIWKTVTCRPQSHTNRRDDGHRAGVRCWSSLVSWGLLTVLGNNRELKGFVKETGEAKKGELEGMEPQLFTNPLSHTVHSKEVFIVISSLWDIVWEAQCDEEVCLLPQELWIVTIYPSWRLL